MTNDTLEVTLGEETFTPIPYNTFKVGPFIYKTVVQDNETDEEAFDRAYGFLERMARKSFIKKRNDFFMKYKSEGHYG